MSGSAKVVVLDDDPTGTQDVSGVPVLLRPSRESLVTALGASDTVFVLTNTRALPEVEVTRLLTTIRADIEAASDELGALIRVVLRGDSTLRGHILAEADVFGARTGTIVLCAAFPEAGRITENGVHRVRIGTEWLNAADTEFAADPVFGYTARTMLEYIDDLEPGRPARLADANSLASVLTDLQETPGSVVLLDARSNDDLRSIAETIEQAWDAGAGLVVRSAAPLAAFLGHAKSTGLLAPLNGTAERILVVVGSHTAATTRQLAAIPAEGMDSVVISTDTALEDPARAAHEVEERLGSALQRGRLVVLSSERVRRSEHSSLDEGAHVMAALTGAVRAVRTAATVVIAKGGITSAQVARDGLGADHARVLGQIQTGISVWSVPVDGREIPYVVVPGNIGEDDALVRVLDWLGAN